MWVGYKLQPKEAWLGKAMLGIELLGRQHKAKTCSNQRGTFSKLPNKQMKACQVGNAFGSNTSTSVHCKSGAAKCNVGAVQLQFMALPSLSKSCVSDILL